MQSLYEQYGAGFRRIPFTDSWTCDPQQPFECTEEAGFARVSCPRDFPAAWSYRTVNLDPSRPCIFAIKIRCLSEERGPHVILGARVRGRGGFLLRQGGFGTSWNNLGPYGLDAAGRNMDGFNTNDWHVYTFRIEPGWKDCRVFYDTEEALAFKEPWGEASDDALLIGTEHPGQEIQVDWLWLGHSLPPLDQLFLPALFPLDWDLRNVTIEVGAVQRHPANPVLSPGTQGAREDRLTYDAWVLREPDGYRMWYIGRGGSAPDSPSHIYHAVSSDGISWEKTPDEPVLGPGAADEWDSGGVQSPVVHKSDLGYIMWYAGYLKGYRQARTGVARSPDGLHWERIPVRAFPFRSSCENNICYPLQDTIYDDQYAMPQCVVRDDDAPPERRYVLFCHAQGRNCIIEVAYSADGLVFRKDENNTRYYAVERDRQDVGRLHQRTSVVHRDGFWWTFFGLIPSGTPAVELRTYFTAWRDETTDGANPSFGPWDSFLQLTPVARTWESRLVWPTCLLEDGDEWKLYYTGQRDPLAEVGLATVGRERLWQLRRLPQATVGYGTSRPIRCPATGWAGHVLEVNVSSPGRSGSVRLALADAAIGQPIPGYEWDDCLPITEDSFRRVVAWRHVGPQLPNVPGNLCVGVALEGSAKFHALRFRPLVGSSPEH